MKPTPEMRQTMAEPDPTVLAIEKAYHAPAKMGTIKRSKKIVRGYLRNAIFVFQGHMVRRALRDLDLKQDELSDELLDRSPPIQADIWNSRDWLLIELNRANVKPKSTNQRCAL